MHTLDNLYQNQAEASTYEYNFKDKFTENKNKNSADFFN